MTSFSDPALLGHIRMIVLDVDGVMTDGSIYYSSTGDELKRFNVHDGYAIVKAQQHKIAVAIISGRSSAIVQRRAQELGIQEVHQNIANKFKVYEKLKSQFSLQDNEIAYIGDDEPDLEVLRAVGFSAAPSDAVDIVRNNVTYVCTRAGGKGAVREVIDLILANR